ncbi:MAG: hypothetical protein EOM91_10935 [Sphingobacteriia bacterium]|nr:hypothetical protein [Sphingobacteriia bacterium]NCC40482.1 hypothetical protein [Gammaproteobacteria bacterium]
MTRSTTIRTQTSGADCASLVRLATLGALVGGSLAAASNLRRVESGDLNPSAAVAATGTTALTTAVATALGGAVASSLAEQGLARLGIMFAAGTLTLYGLQRWSEERGETDE